MQAITRRISNLSNRQILFILVFILTVPSIIGSAIANPHNTDGEWLSGLLQNFGTEMAGAIATFLLFELIVGNRQEKERLIRVFGSQDNAIAKHAIEELRAHGWLEDGSLYGANLRRANLQGTVLIGANLQGTVLIGANLQRANLWDANLQGANLRDANLQRANLWNANLQGTNLRDANLQGAKLDTNTILPDGSKCTEDTDMERFTSPEHKDFWKSGEDD